MGDNLTSFWSQLSGSNNCLENIFIESPRYGVQKVRWNSSISLLDKILVCNYHIKPTQASLNER